MNSTINGFIIIHDFGVVYKEGSRTKSHYVLAVCKHCKKEWKTSYYTLHKIKGCGCNSWSQLKPLPEFINGFRTIECLGYDKVKGVRRAVVECKSCFKNYEVDPNKLQYRKHCGCIVKGKVASSYASSHPRLRGILKHMIARCHNPKNQDFYNYGARGVIVCDEWRNDTDSFCEWALSNGYSDNLSIDRINFTKGYFPDNCKWSNATEQARNTRRVKLNMITAREIRQKYMINPCRNEIVDLANDYNVSDAAIYLIIQNKTWKE